MSERVESLRFPYLPLRIDVQGHALDLEALIDTGFNGDVTLPHEMLEIEAGSDYEARAWLADGSEVRVPAYRGSVQVAGESFPVSLLVIGDEPSVGLRATNRFRLVLDHGERVILEP